MYTDCKLDTAGGHELLYLLQLLVLCRDHAGDGLDPVRRRAAVAALGNVSGVGEDGEATEGSARHALLLAIPGDVHYTGERERRVQPTLLWSHPSTLRARHDRQALPA